MTNVHEVELINRHLERLKELLIDEYITDEQYLEFSARTLSLLRLTEYERSALAATPEYWDKLIKRFEPFYQMGQQGIPLPNLDEEEEIRRDAWNNGGRD
jgi:hypothetical protein